jgi:hypothetical protein
MSAMSTTQARPAAVHVPRPAGAKTFFTWVGLSLLAIPLAGYLGWGIAGHVDSVMPALIGGALTGAGIGFAQWLMLRRSLGVGAEWIAATSAGLAVGLAIGAVVVGYGTTTSQLAIMGAISGAFVGIAQGLLLRDKFSLWYVWIAGMPVLWALGWVVTDAWGIDVAKQFTVFGASGAVVFGILSGLLLMAVMRERKSASGSA